MRQPSIGPTTAKQRYVVLDGKFYTIFSILFGIGFSITLSRRGISR